MRTDTAPAISRHDYQPYPYRLPRVALQFDLDAECTRVHARFEVERDGGGLPPLVLNGQELSLVSVSIDGTQLDAGKYRLDDETLTLFPEAARFIVEIASECRPAQNSALMGLYVSGESLFTQCEAEGFRRITWFPDRPDVMSRYTVTLRGDKTAYPLLLSNGNLVAGSELENGRHEAVWEDPHPKPCYLFALVAGSFDCLERRIRTGAGRNALLQIYSDKGSRNKTEWALDCLHRSVQWDEQRFGLQLDLDRFMVVAARDFNMGAMENKGLNIFNSSYVLAEPDTATDASYHGIESVIGHEYFHNWTGNRVTCRDWFQLSLKEGLTVFRDQQFSADMMAHGLSEDAARSARAVKRIDDVTALRVAQFPEDAGPMAHPIRPESYQEIANFYTATVYEKGAEVIRMQHTLLGEEDFQAGIREYFRRHDGQAVTCDDFVDAMDSVYRARHPGKSLDVFRRWYSQAGTPRVHVTLQHDADQGLCSITLRQHCPPVGIEKLQSPPLEKPPLHIPFALGLLDAQGQALALRHEGQEHETVVLDLCAESQTWTFPDIAERPVASLLRDFSAPVIVEYDRDDAELALLARHDTDPFARWEAGQELASRQLLAMSQSGSAKQEDAILIETWRALLHDPALSDAYRARVLTLPATKALLEKTDPMDPLAVAQAREDLRARLGQALADSWLAIYQACAAAEPREYSPDAVSSGRRALKNLALAYLAAGRHPQAESLAQAQYESARNMTDRMGALSALVGQGDTPAATRALRHFYEQWQHDPLVVDRWFALQATACATRTDTVRALMLHPAFTLRNPNRARSLIFQFCMNNMLGVHRPEGYEFWAEQVLALDALNPEIAARLARAFDSWARYAPSNRDAVHSALQRIQQHEPLSRNVAEIVSKALNI
ncbi:aminopeptidase N [Pusillimonas noertemannii]|uniref:Aminopeptidase N n=1 Tax=Pusillimonas noertemannii TaxID=305977 RepID=A0A2U1CKH9_9BURK|nr:aminopeptidase N [Pusillimonas noertemannii]NYT69573.1 aminopeptidase N [Pusillimonas noertemannii]PVY61503.1 aminopeptidase N [Pusillimonas noertemannii]TFL08906.1 aminopeptidase N [Pusillimonas noertemannii]